MDLIELAIIAALGIGCGALGQLTSRYSRGGWIVYIFIGIAGATLGTYLARYFNAPDIFNLKLGKTDFPIIWALIGSVFSIAFINFLVKPGGRQ
jgi:uncharacterized membrane protein YeaQ/YmgE (transglycosylase-associated protein family)